MMPGAFVFEPTDSVESIQVNGGRTAVQGVALPALVRIALVRAQPRSEVADRLPSTWAIGLRRDAVVKWLPRTPLDPAPPSEDPH